MGRAEGQNAAGLTRAQVKALQERLERGRADALALLTKAEVAARSSDDGVLEAMDAAEATGEQSSGALLVARARERLEEIDHALDKIAAGSYGLSERSGLPIGFGRLQAVPWARFAADEVEEPLTPPSL
jgi:DnaK suppressor protein